MAALYREVIGIGPARLATRLLPVGAGLTTAFEIPGYSAEPGRDREVLRALVRHCLSLDADWSVVAIAPEQGWFEPEQVSDADAPISFFEPVRPRACIVLRLGPTWPETRGALKRNLKESLRRSRNRLTKSGLPFRTRHRTGTDVDVAAVQRLFDLHRRRSTNEVARVTHPDAFADRRNRELMLAALPRLGAQGLASVLELELDGEIVASQLALHATGSSYLHSSGFHPDVWELGPVTHLQGELVQYAIGRGDTVVNFSPGPSVSKVRWSEETWVSQEFAFGAGPRSLRLRYGALRGLSLLHRSAGGVAWTPGRAGR